MITEILPPTAIGTSSVLTLSFTSEFGCVLVSVSSFLFDSLLALFEGGTGTATGFSSDDSRLTNNTQIDPLLLFK